MITNWDFVIIGAGSAGRSAAEYLSENSGGRTILLIDTEMVLPYKRTQVSKNVAAGFEPDDFRIHDALWYRQNGVELRIGATVRRIDAEGHRLELDSGEAAYGMLLIASGSAPYCPFGKIASDRVSSLWDVREGRLLHDLLARGSEVAIIGNGVLGVEAAWQCCLMGVSATIYGKGFRPMAKYLDDVCSISLSEAIRKSGIVQRSGIEVKGIAERNHGLTIQTDNGEFPADYAIVAAGSRPRTAIAAAAGIKIGKGILVDSSLRTSEPDIWAAGDCAEHPDGMISGLWHSAENQGKLAAQNMMGTPVVNTNPSYRLKCEVFGGFWFSAGPVKLNKEIDDEMNIETWEAGPVVWRPTFRSDVLVSLCGAALGGLDKNAAKSAQDLVLEGAGRDESHAVLTSGIF